MHIGSIQKMQSTPSNAHGYSEVHKLWQISTQVSLSSPYLHRIMVKIRRSQVTLPKSHWGLGYGLTDGDSDSHSQKITPNKLLKPLMFASSITHDFLKAPTSPFSRGRMREYSVVHRTSLSLLTGRFASFPKRSKQSALESSQARTKLILYKAGPIVLI